MHAIKTKFGKSAKINWTFKILKDQTTNYDILKILSFSMVKVVHHNRCTNQGNTPAYTFFWRLNHFFQVQVVY